MQEDIRYTEDDIKKAFDLHYAKQFPLRSKLLLILGSILSITAIYFFLNPSEKFPIMNWLFAMMGIFYIGFYFYRKRSMVKLAMKNPTIKDMRRIILNEEHIRFEGEKGFTEQKWELFNEFTENEDAILLYLTKHNFFILSKRFLSKDSESFILGKLSKGNA